MFKYASCENELFENMEKIHNELSFDTTGKQLNEAINYLKSAAQNLNKDGFAKEASQVIELINKLSKKDRFEEEKLGVEQREKYEYETKEEPKKHKESGSKKESHSENMADDKANAEDIAWEDES